MKKIFIYITTLLLFTQCESQESNQLKRYNVSSAIIKYTSKTNGKVMGGTVTGSGTKTLFFTKYGALELQEEKSTQTTKINVMGKSINDTQSSHNIAKLDNGKQYVVNFDNKVIYESNDPLMTIFKNTNTDVTDAGRKMLENMGGKQIGNENFNGYNCELWSVPGGKQWVYKGIPLKLEISALGITTITEATSIELDVNVPSKHFKLPDFPIEKQQSFLGDFNDEDFQMEDMNEIKANMKNISKLSYEEWKKMALKDDEEMQQMSEKELRETYNMIQKMAKSLD